MDSSIVWRLRQLLGKIESALSSAWTTALTYVGATEDASLWWKAVFERRILKGEVGMSLGWFRSKKMDVLWELELLVKSLSHEDLVSTGKPRKRDDSPTKPSTSTQCGTGQNSNLNCYWFTDQSLKINLHLRKSKQHVYRDYIGHDERNEWYSKQMKRASKYYCHEGQTICVLNQSVDNTGNYFNEVETYTDLANGPNRQRESITQRTKSQFAAISTINGIRPQRSASCPDMFCSRINMSTFSEQNGSCNLKHATSLPSHYSEGDVFENDNSTKLSKVKNMSKSTACNTHFDWAKDTSHCFRMKKNHPVTDKDINQIDLNIFNNKGLDELLSHKDTLDLLWEADLSPEKEMCSLNKYKVNGNQSYLRDNCTDGAGNNNCEENSSFKACSSTNSIIEFLYYPETLSSVHKSSPIEQELLTENDLRNTITTNGSIINNGALIDNIQDEYKCGLNWNAFVDGASSSVDRHAATDNHGGTSCPSSLAWNTSTSAAIPRNLNIPTTACVPDINSSRDYTDNSDTRSDRLLKSLQKSVDKLGKVKLKGAGLLTKAKKIGRVITDSDRLTSTNTTLLRSTEAEDIPGSETLEPADMGALHRSTKSDVIKRTELASENAGVFPCAGLESESVKFGTHAWISRSARVLLNLAQPSRLCPRALLAGRRKKASTEQKRQANSNNSQPGVRTDTTGEKPGVPVVKYYLTGRSAYMYYKLLAMTEAKYKIARLHAERNYFKQLYTWKLDTLIDIVRTARDYYSDPTETNLARWKTLKRNLSKEHQSYTDVRMQVSNIPDYYPYFTFALVLLQILTLAVLCMRYGFSDAGLATVSQVRHGVPTFLGTESFRFMAESNPWLGPPVHSFIAAGAVVSSCMRPVEQLKTITAHKGYRLMTDRNRFYFGCCEMVALFNRAGTTTQSECEEMTSGLGKWTMGVLCSDRPSTKNSVAHVIKPCCTGSRGECVMISHEHCDFIQGVFHTDCDHCVQVNCLKELCKLSSYSEDDVMSLERDVPWLPGRTTQWQWWRFLSAIPLSYGVIHLSVLILVEITMMLPLEMCVGWHRVIIVYVSSAIVGEMVSYSLEQFAPHVGSTSGAAGIIGVAVLDLFQAWGFLQCPLWEAVKLLAVIIFISFLGTFYLISVISFLTGLVVGAILCLVIIPYITYGRRLGYYRSRLVLFGFILIILGWAILPWFLRFLETCDLCLLMECVPYTDGLCTLFYQKARMLDN